MTYKVPENIMKASENITLTQLELDAALSEFNAVCYKNITSEVIQSSNKAHEALDRLLEAKATIWALAKKASAD